MQTKTIGGTTRDGKKDRLRVSKSQELTLPTTKSSLLLKSRTRTANAEARDTSDNHIEVTSSSIRTLKLRANSTLRKKAASLTTGTTISSKSSAKSTRARRTNKSGRQRAWELSTTKKGIQTSGTCQLKCKKTTTTTMAIRSTNKKVGSATSRKTTTVEASSSKSTRFPRQGSTTTKVRVIPRSSWVKSASLILGREICRLLVCTKATTQTSQRKRMRPEKRSTTRPSSSSTPASAATCHRPRSNSSAST